MEAFKNIAIAGACGQLGQVVTRVILADGSFQVKLLCHKGEKNNSDREKLVKEFGGKGAQIIVSDYNNIPELKTALEGTQVILSFISGPTLEHDQLALIKAAIGAKVSRFIPSEFGIDTSSYLQENKIVQMKSHVAQAVEDSVLDYTIIRAGYFMELMFSGPYFGFDVPHKNVRIVGSGDVPVSFTHRVDLANFLIALFKEPAKTKNEIVSFVSDTRTFNECLEMAETHFGDDFHVEREDVAKVEARVKANNYGIETFVDQIHLLAEKGLFCHNGSGNKLFPNVKTTSVDQVYFSLRKK